MKKVLVTGATGFLGRHLVNRLKRRGLSGRLRLLNRRNSEFDADPDVEAVRGDICSPADVDRAVEGCEAVYHLAGFVSRDPKDALRLYEVHVAGTRHVCEAALRHQVERMVLVSSSGTVAVSREPIVHDETSGYKINEVAEWAYYLSKIYAEKTALSFHRREGLPVVVANPALLLGPGDEAGSSTGDIALFLRGQIQSMPLGGMSFVDARDAAGGIIAAMEQGRPGERYLLGGPNWTFRDIIERLSELSGRRPPLLTLSVPASLLAARIMRRITRFELDDATIKMSAMFWYCDSSKAARELGFRTRDPMETLRETIHDIRARGIA
jgi:dihydroflavonol-4-reductase